MAKDEYTFTFLKGTTQTAGAAAGKARPQAGDAALKSLYKNLEKILKDSSKDSSEKFTKSLEKILTKFARVQTQTKGTAAPGGLSSTEARRIAKEVASEFVNQQVKQLTKAFPSPTAATKPSDAKVIQSIEKSADRQAKTIIAGLNSILSKKGIQLEDTKNLERAVSGAMKSAIPKETGTGIKEIGKTVALLRSGIGDINKLVKQIAAMRQSGGGIDVKEIKEMMRSFQQLNQKFKQITESSAKAGKAIESVTDDVAGFKKSLSDIKQAAGAKVRGVRERAEADPTKFAKTTATAVGQALEKALQKSPSFKGSQLESTVKKFDQGIKNINDVLNKFKKIQSDISTSMQKGQISIDTKAIVDLSKDLGQLPKKIGVDIETKGWKDLTKGLENFAKTANTIIGSLKKLKIEAGVDTKQIEKKVEDAVRKGAGRGLSDSVKGITKEIEASFNKVLAEMRVMYKALPKESPLRPKFEKAGKELKAAKEREDYPYIAKRVGGMQDVIKAPVLNQAINELKGAIVEMTSEFRGAGIDEKLQKSGKALDELTSTVEKRKKEFASSKLDPARAMDKIKFLQTTAKTFPQKTIEPGMPFELKGTEMGYGADVRRAVKEKADSLAMSLKNLEKDLITGLQAGPGFKKFGWKLLDKQLKEVGQQWTLQIAQIGGKGGVEELLKQLDKTYVKIEDPKTLLQTYERKRKQKITDTTKQRTVQADKVGKWLTQRTTEDIEELSSANLISKTTESTLKEVKSKYKGTEVGEKMRKELVDRLGESLNNVFKETFAAEEVKRELTSGDAPLVKRIALPAAQISKTGTAIFKTRYGTERALPKFATYRTGFEELFDRMREQKAMADEESRKFQDEIIDIGMKPTAITTLPQAKTTSKEMLSRMAKAGPQQLEFVMEQYKEAATMVGAKRQKAGMGDISGYEKKISTGISDFRGRFADLPSVFEQFVDEMEELGVSAYDVVKSLESIKFENVYDIYRKVLKKPISSPTGKPGVAEFPGRKSTLRAFDQAVAQVEQLMPIIEKSKVRRGKHQEEVTTTLFQTSPIYKGAAEELKFDANKQKNKILAINMNLREMLSEYETLTAAGAEMTGQTAKRLERYTGPGGIPRGVKTISTLGPPEEQAAKYREYRGMDPKARALAPLESTAIKLYTEKLLDQAPFGEFSRLGKQISYVNSAMSSLSAQAGKVFDVPGVTTTEPKFRTTRERELTSAGRYGTTGYGFNVIAELKHSADTFEDQIVVSGRLADALTQAVSTLVKPGPKGRLGTLGGAHVTDIEAGKTLRDVTNKEINKVATKYMEILGVPEEYKKEADKALIETVKKEIVAVRGKDVEVQKAQLAEVFMNYFGRKFTTRYGSKGVSITAEDLGMAQIPKTMGQLASDILGKVEKEGKAPKFGKLKDVPGMQKALVESGNKFMISMFSDATSEVAKGLGVPEEIDKQAKIYKDFTAIIKRVYGEELPKDVEGITQLKKLYTKEVGGKFYEEKPIDIRISARGAIKRGLQPEFIETMMGNVIGMGAGETTVKPRLEKDVYEKILGTREQKGLLTEYSKALGFTGAGVSKKDIEAELFKTFKAAGKTDEEAKVMAERAAAFEEVANYYTTVKNEYGKAVKSIVGPKFVQIIEEPHETEKWSAEGVKELRKAAKINVAAYSAYAGVFGERSPLMKQIQGGTTLESKKQFEYIKALESMAVSGPGKEMADALMKGLRKIPLGELREFEPRTGTFGEEDIERSLKGTVLDIEKFASEFIVDLPVGRGPKGEVKREPFYVPGPLARQTYPEKLLAGEYGMEDISRRLQTVINVAKEAEAALAGEGPQVKDVHNLIKTKVLEAVNRAARGATKEKTEVFETFWKGLKDIQVDVAFRQEADLPEGTTETQYISSFFEKWKANYAQQGKSVDEAMQLTIRRMADILVGVGEGGRADLVAAKPRLAKEVEAGTTAEFAKRLGVDTTNDEEIAKKLNQLRNAKVEYMNVLAESLLGKSGAVQATFFERKAPAVIGKAIAAVTDRTSELQEFGSTLRNLAMEAGFEKYVDEFGNIANVIDEIGAEHKDIISKYKKEGIPVLKQEELGIPETIAKKIPVTFEKRYEMMSGMPVLTGKTKKAATVESNLYKMLEYKEELEKGLSKVDIKSDVDAIQAFVERELIPHVETLRFPFTGVSSLQPYKAKTLKKEDYPKSQFTYAVPGVPEMRMATEGGKTGFVEVIKQLEGIRDEFAKAREALHTTAEAAGMQADPARVGDLTDKIAKLDKAISDVLPKYTAIQQKLDFDGDEIEAHSGVLAEARQDIKKHFDVLNQSTDSIETAWRSVRGFEEAAPGATSTRFPFADLLTYFESKWAPEKGYDFLKTPELTEKLEFLKPAQKLEIMSAVPGTGKPQDILRGITEELVTEPSKRAEILQTIDNSVKEGNDTSKQLLDAIKMLDSDFSKLIEAGVSESLYQQKYADAIIGQLYKLHTGPETEAIYRMQRVAESRMGFGGGMIAPEAGSRTEAAGTFRRRWPTGMQISGKLAPESEISTFMNELSRFAQQKGMDVKLAGEKPVGGEITTLLAQGTEGVNKLLVKIGMAGDQADEDYAQLKEFADTSATVIEKRLGVLPTEAIRKEVGGLRKTRGMPEITMGTRKQAVDEAVKLIGFEGFLRELAKQIEEDAVEALTAKLEAMPELARKERMGRKSFMTTREFAQEEIKTSPLMGIPSPGGISTSQIMEQRMPLYGFRAAAATPGKIAERYRETAEEVRVPSVLKGATAEKYKQAQEVALSIARSLKEVGQMKPGGTYSEMVLSTIDNMYKEQEKKEYKLNELKKEGYDIGLKREVTDIPKRMLEGGMPDIPEFIKELVDPSNAAAGSLQKLKQEIDEISLLAGVPPLSAEARRQIKFETPELAAAARAKYPEVTEESEGVKAEREDKISKFTDLLIQKAQAVAQMDRAIAALVSSKGFETKLLPPKEDIRKALEAEIQSTIKTPTGRPTVVAPSAAKELREDIEKAGTMFFEETKKAAAMPGGGGPGAGVPGEPLTGRPSDEIVRVHIQSVQEGIGLSFTPAGAVQDVIDVKRAGATSHLDELRELQKRAAGVSKTLEETYKNVYRASALFGGGVYEGKGPKGTQQIEAIKEFMVKGATDVPPRAEALGFEGTLIHKKEQDRLAKELEAKTRGKQAYDVERYVRYTSSVGKDITGHVDLIQQRLDEDTKKYVDEKVIDIKTVDESMVKRFKELGVKRFSDLGAVKEKGGLTQYDIQKLEDVASQINLYIAAVAQANNVAAESLKGEAWFYDRDDIKNIAKISFDFDPGLLKKDINAIAKARKAVVSEYGKESFAKATNMLDLEKAEARRKEGKEPLSTKEWERFEKLSKEHRGMVEDPSSSFWMEKGAKPPGLTKEKLRAGQAGQRARFEEYTIPEAPVMGEAVFDQLENLKRMHTSAKEYQRRAKGIDIKDVGATFHESLASIIGEVQETGPQAQKFAEQIEDLKFAGMMGGGDITKAWKFYRIALGDFFIRQAEEARNLEQELQKQGELGGAREAYQQAERTINTMKKRISQALGKPSDIYTEMRRYISPDIAQQLGVYLTPEQLLTKAKGPLGDDEKLDEMFKKTIVGDVMEGGKLIAPIEKVREALKGVSDLDEEMIKTLTDADKFKRAGTEIQEAWNFEKLTERVTKLRASLETFLRFRLQEDADVVGRKNLEDTLKLLKNLENQYSSFGRVQREGPAGWGEMGITKVPRVLEPKQQFAMHQRNIQKVREYFTKTEEGGGPQAGERYTYMFKVMGEAGDTIKNVAYDFKKYGDALNYAGERTGIFSESQRDIFKLMQEGGQTFRSAIMRAVRWGAASRIVYGGWQKLGQSISLLADIETGMANIRMIMSPMETDFDAMGKSAIGFAKQYGVPMTDVLKSMKIFAQQGLQQGEVINRTETATLASNVTTLSAQEATEALTAAMKVFRQEGESSMRFMDAWSEVEAKHAITAGDMANALKKAASAGKNAGFTFDELNGIVAAVGSVTRQTGKEVGTAMRFIFRRLASEKGPKELAKIGIPVLTETGELRKGFDVLNDLSMSWKDLTSAQRMNIAQAIGGTRQYNALLVLMDNWNEALSAIEDSTNSKGSAERRNLEIMKTFTKQMEQMKAAATEVYMAFGKITFPIAKVGLKGLKFLLEAFTEVPGVIKGAMVAVAGFFVYMSKGADIIDYFFERWRGGKSIVSDVMSGMRKEWTMGMAELFGIGALEENLKTLGKKAKVQIPTGVFEVSPEGVAKEQVTETLIPQGKTIKDFHSVLGKTTFILKQTGMSYNEFIADMVKGGGSLVKDVGGPFDYLGKKLLAFSALMKGSFDLLAPDALVGILAGGGPTALLAAIPAVFTGVAAVATGAAGKASEKVSQIADFAGDKFGKAGKSFVEQFASDNTSMVKAMAPLAASMMALYPALKSLSEYYIKTTRSAQDYEKVMYGVRRATESQLKGIRELISGYTGLEGSLAEAVKVSDPDVKKRRQELGTFESPLLTMASVIKKSRDYSNSLADTNVNLVAGYDKFGNAILNITGNLKDYLKTLENIKIKEAAKIEIDIAAKFITDLTEIEGPEKWKYALKNLLKEAPAFGEVLAKGIKISPAKAMDVVSERLNDMLALKKKFPMSTAFDKDIKKQQDNLKKVRVGFRSTYTDFRRVLSDIGTKGLTKGDIAALLGTEELRKGYELMIEIEPRFNLKETKGKVEWQDVLGAEVMRRAFPSFAATFDATSVLTKARLETAGAVQRQGKAMSGDVAFFMDDAADKYSMAGSQAVVSLRETTDGVFDWFVTYFNSKTLTVEERPFTEDLQNMVESIFPKSRIEEELSERIQSLNEFTAGAAAGLRGLSAKDFKRDFGLGERFFSDIATTTILQGPKGFVPGARGAAPTFGESPFQKDWKETTQEFFFKPMREYRLKAEQLERLRLEGLQGGEVTLARGLWEELTKLQDVLKNNQVVLQYRAVFVDFTKTLEEGTRALKESLAVEQSRLKLRKGVAGYQKGMSEGLDAIDLGVQRFSDLTVKQRALRAGPEYGRAATRFRELETRRTAKEEQVYGVDRALVALENIRQVSSGFGAALSSDDMKKYTEIIAKTDDTGAQSIAIETSKVVDNTASTVDRLDSILENMGDVEALERQLEGIGDMSPGKIVDTMEKVARVRDKKLDIGDKDSARSANKTLDVLTSTLVEQVGVKKAMSMVDSNFTLFSKKFKPEEFTQRAFGGLDFKQFVAGMEENLPKQRSFFKRMLGMGEDLSGFKEEIKPLTKLQEKNNREQWLSAKDTAKMGAALAVWTGLNKHQSRDTISALEKQRQEYKPGTEERADLERRIEKEKKGSLAEGKVGEQTWATAQSLSALTAGISLFGKEIGLTEGQIKKLTLAIGGLYGAAKIVEKPEGKQAGGLIMGPGGPKDDKIRIDASKGEYVVKASSTGSVGKEALDYINKYGMLPGMQAGGIIAPRSDKPFDPKDINRKLFELLGYKKEKGPIEKLKDKLKELEDKVILDERPRTMKIPGLPDIEDLRKFQLGGIIDSLLEWGGVFGKEGSISDLAKGLKDSFGGKDNIPIRVSAGEYIINQEKAKKLGYDKLDYINEYGKLPGFQEGGVVGSISEAEAAPTAKVPTINISNRSILKLRNLLLPYLAATATGYVAQRTEDDTRLTTLNAQAQQEAEIFAEIVEKYPKAAQKMIDARRQLVENIEKVTPVPTTEKTLVMDTERERERVAKDLAKIKEDIIEQYEDMNDEMSKVAKKMAKLEVAEQFKKELEEMERAVREVDIASAALQALESSIAGYDFSSVFDLAPMNLGRIIFSQWGGDVEDWMEDRMEDMTGEVKFPKSAGKLAGKYKPQPVDYGIRGITEMTPEQYMAYSGKRVAYKPSMKQFFGEEVSGPQPGEMGIVTLLKDVLAGRTAGFAKVRTAEQMFSELENMQKKREIKQAKFIESVTRREELKERGGFLGRKLSETEKEELNQLDDVIEDLGDSLSELTEDIGRSKDALKEALEEAADIIRQRVTAFDALKALEDFNIERMFGGTAVLNKALVGFGGGYELPMGKREMSLQQRVFTDATDDFNKSATEYAYKINTLLPSMSQNISEISSLRQQAGEETDPERYEELTKQLDNAKDAMSRMIESTRAMGEALSVANRFAEVMYKFGDAIEDINIAESVEELEGFKGFRESMDKVFGGAHPLAPVQVSPAEERRAAQVGIQLRDLRSTRFEKMEAEALYQVQYGGLQGKQLEEAMRTYMEVPEVQRREVVAYEQRKEVTQLQRQAAPFEELLTMLQRLSISEDITPERREEVIGVRDALSNAIDGFGTIMTQQEKLTSLEKSKAIFTGEEYAQAKKLIETGAAEQYKALPAESLKRLVDRFGADFERMQKGVPGGEKDLSNVFGQGIGDITSRQDDQTFLLKQIAKIGFNLSPEQVGEKPEADSLLNRIIKYLDSIAPKYVEEKKAAGGRIFGAGGPREDKVPAMLSPGEYVIRAAAAQKLGYGALEHMNQKGAVPGFQEGGSVWTTLPDWFGEKLGRKKGERQDLAALLDEEHKKRFKEIMEENALYKEKKKVSVTGLEEFKKGVIPGYQDGGGVFTKNIENINEFIKVMSDARIDLAGKLPEQMDELSFFKNLFKQTGLATAELATRLFVKAPADIAAMAEGLTESVLMEGVGATLTKGYGMAKGIASKEGIRSIGEMIKQDVERGGLGITAAGLEAVGGIGGGAKLAKHAKKEYDVYKALKTGIIGKKPGKKELKKIGEALEKSSKRPGLSTREMVEAETLRALGPESKYLLDAVKEVGPVQKLKALIADEVGAIGPGVGEAKRLANVKTRFKPLTDYILGPKRTTVDDIVKILEKEPQGKNLFQLQEVSDDLYGFDASMVKEAADRVISTRRKKNVPGYQAGGAVRYFTDEGEVDKEYFERVTYGGPKKERTDSYEPVVGEGKRITGFKRMGEWDEKKEEDWARDQLAAIRDRIESAASAYDVRDVEEKTLPEVFEEISPEGWADDPKSMAWINTVVAAKRKARSRMAEEAKPTSSTVPFKMSDISEAPRKDRISPWQRLMDVVKWLKESWSTAKERSFGIGASTAYGGVGGVRAQMGGMVAELPEDEDEEKLFKGKGPPLPGGQTFERARDIMRSGAFAEAKQRAEEAATDKFEPTEAETTRIKPGKVEDFEFRGYEIPGKIMRAGEGQKTITPGAKEGTDLHTLREMQRKIKFLAGNKEKAYETVVPEDKEKFDAYLKSQNERVNNLITHLQTTGKPLSAEKAWDKEYKRSYFPKIDEYWKVKKEFDRSSDIVYKTMTAKALVDKYKDFPEVRGFPTKLPSEQHSNIVKLIDEGKTEEAKVAYAAAIKERETFRSTLTGEQKQLFGQMLFGAKRGSFIEAFKPLRIHSALGKKQLLTHLTDQPSDTVINIMRKFFPDLRTMDQIKEKLNSMSQSEVDKMMGKPTGEVKHHGGEIRKTGHVFMQKGEMVYPKGFAEGGEVLNELATAGSLNGTMEVKVDTSALDAAISKLEGMELKVEDTKLEAPEFPKLEVNTDNVNFVVDGDAAAAKIQAAVENINIDVSSTGAVGAEELQNVSAQLEDRINSLNLSVEDMQNELKMVSGGETLDINTLVSTRIREYTTEVDGKIGEVRSDMSMLASRVEQNQNMINVVTTEIDRKVMHLQNLTGKGAA